MKKTLVGMILLASMSSTLSFAETSQEYLCGKDTDYPVLITVTDGAITNYKDQYYETECVSMASDEEINSQQEEIRKQIANAPSKEAKVELEKYLELLENKPHACVKKDPPSMASFNAKTMVLTELNMKYNRFEQLECILNN